MRRRVIILAQKAMTIERAMANSIASLKMEGFKISPEMNLLIKKVLSKELTISEALKDINMKYRQEEIEWDIL